MLSDKSHGFPLKEHIIKSGKENIQKCEKYMNAKIIKTVLVSYSTFSKNSPVLKSLICLFTLSKN